MQLASSTPQNNSVRTLVIGAGSWGTALAVAAAQSGSVLLWSRHQEQVDHINQLHRNPSYLQDIDLPKALRATADKEEAIAFLQGLSDDSIASGTQSLIIFHAARAPRVASTLCSCRLRAYSLCMDMQRFRRGNFPPTP